MDFKRFGNVRVQLLPGAAQETIVHCIADQRVLEAINRIGGRTALEYQPGDYEAAESGLEFILRKTGDSTHQHIVKLTSDRRADLRD